MVEDVPIDLEKDETGDDRLLVMYTVGSKRGSWTETEAQGPCPFFFPGEGGGDRVKNEHRGWGQLGRETTAILLGGLPTLACLGRLGHPGVSSDSLWTS